MLLRRIILVNCYFLLVGKDSLKSICIALARNRQAKAIQIDSTYLSNHQQRYLNKICTRNSTTLSQRIKVTSHALTLKETVSHFIELT